LALLHPLLRDILGEAIQVINFTITTSVRNKEEQDRLYRLQKSKVEYPHSKHNKVPAEAVDVAPWHRDQPHIRWGESDGFVYLAGIIVGIGKARGITVRWGGDWDRDGDLTNERFRDLGHLELVLPVVVLEEVARPGLF
jgi:hypothetical protein